ncbi:MAG: phospholipase [Gammaproteobacteria bacterium]
MIEAIGELLPPLLGTLDRVEWVQRRLYPSLAGQLAEELAPRAELIAGPLRALEAVDWPDDFRSVRERLVDVARRTLDVVGAFVETSRAPGHPIDLYRVLRRFAPLQEALYPLAGLFEPVSRWFLEPSRRLDDELLARFRALPPREDGVQVGVLHGKNERDQRGGFSVYVPEWWDGETAMPLIVALHGGHGHGRDFLWSWLREARTRGAIVLSPTSRDRTWSILSPDDVDAPPLREMLAFVSGRYPVDPRRVLLTGMSDGATYTFLCGLREDMPFTHLAPACGVLHPLLLDGRLGRARDLPIYLIHGALDWMFPVQMTRMSKEFLVTAGARLVYREIEDLSHIYPRDENPRILDWLDGTIPPE